MQPYQQRVIDEKEALDKKLADLHTFVKDGKPDTAVRRGLLRQAMYMEGYSKVLGERIAEFPKEAIKC